MPDQSSNRLLADWPENEIPLAPDLCLSEMLAAQAARAPDALALIWGDSRLTYGELDHRAGLLAHYLLAGGVGPEARVGVCIQRSPELVIALLAVVKLGASYVPMDPAYPPARLVHMLRDSGVRVLLTQQGIDRPDGSADLECVRVDSEWDRIAAADSTHPLPAASPGNAIYAIYTSGSTGKPKGSVVFYRGFINLLAWYAREFKFGPATRTLLMSSASFDLTQKNIFTPLLTGGQLVLLTSPHYDPDAIRGAIREHAITAVNCTPSAFLGLLSEAGDSVYRQLASLEYVFLGGEPISVSRLLPWVNSAFCRATVVNTYGPTECTDVCAFHRLTDYARYARASVPIGGPVTNTEMLVLNADGARVAPGETGELYIGGVGVGGGYLNRPELTAERFVPNPFDGGTSRLYRTGDLARSLPDGEIEFLGRVDNQVKLRGFRVELGDIESALERCPSVREAVCLLREDHPGRESLTAYVVPRAETPAVEALRRFLTQTLPDYMLPADWVFLARMPLTPNGKVDRRALPLPQGLRPELGVDYEAPAGEVERALAGIWCELLHVDRAGRQDSFFDLGGHSLLAIQVIARLRDVFGVSLSPASLFEAPALSELALRIEALREAPPPSRPAPARVARGQRLPLSFAQLRMWYLDTLDPGTPLYNLPSAFRLRGALDVAKLARCLNAIVDRHEVLRTTFASEDGTPYQVIAPRLDLELPVLDFRNLSPWAVEDAVAGTLYAEANRPFDLSAGPLVRASLLRKGEHEHILFFMAHHAVFDGLSFPVFLRELAALYGCPATGDEKPALPALPVQYADFAVWERGELEGGEQERLAAYWREVLDGELPVLDLPTDRPRPPARSHHGETRTARLPPELVAQLSALARREGVTMFMLLLAAFNGLLYRWTGQQDLTVGTPVSSRTHPALEPLLGCFVDTVVLRTRLEGALSFSELLARVKAVCIGAFKHQALPFERIVEEIRPRRDLSRTPIYQAMFSFDEMTETVQAFGEVTLTNLDVVGDQAITDLWLRCRATPRGIDVALNYSTDIFIARTADSLLEHFRVLLENAAAAPRTGLARIDLLTPRERTRLLVEWNRTDAEYPRDACVQHVFESQAHKTPDAVAVVSREAAWSYRELDECANRIARHLQALSVGPETLVGICVERSAQMVAAVLGVLKSGGAYVPLDPDYPAERRAFMLADARAGVILTQQSLRSGFEEQGLRVVCLDSDWAAILEQSGDKPACRSGPQSTAYVIYTSGSTGKPKGVQVHHGAVVNFLVSMSREPGLAAEDAVVALTTLSFDIAALEIFLPLVVGGRVVIATREDAWDGVRLMEFLKTTGVTVMQAAPAGWRVLIGAGWTGDPPLRALCGGEAMPAELAAELRARCGAVWNMYGPTETTVWSTCWRLTDDGGPIRIGRPIANTQVYILDASMQPVPVGVRGELYIGGDGVTQGYLGRPELTVRAFLPNPFTGDPAARIYRTGDIARYLPDGEIECFGRIDNQIKLRGFRIEPGEIEAALAEHPDVDRAAAIVWTSRSGDRRLVGYYVPAGGRDPGVAALRDVLRDRLPAYMVPQHLVAMAALPLTPSGKIDRMRLPDPEDGAPGAGDGYVAPGTETESAVAGIWRETLGRDVLGIHDNFFDLGGHSLLAAQILAALRRKFGVELSLRRVLESPTVAGMAKVVEDLVLAEIDRMSEAEAEALLGPTGTEECGHERRG